MAESKRNSTSSTSKNRKSRSELLRTTLGSYLRQRNHTRNEKFSKGELALTQNAQQKSLGLMLEDDMSKPNSFLYSNVLCLSNHTPSVEQQFEKFIQFVDSQKVETKKELEGVLSPLLCHLFIELMKGKEANPAQDFLRKFAHIVAPIENLNAPSFHKVNGCTLPLASSLSDGNQIVPPVIGTQINFQLNEDGAKDSKNQEFFKELITKVSSCVKNEELDSISIASKFRSAKYEMELSQQSIFALKHYLLKNGNLIILHLINTWFSFENSDVRECRENLFESTSEEDPMEPQLNGCDNVLQLPSPLLEADNEREKQFNGELNITIKSEPLDEEYETNKSAMPDVVYEEITKTRLKALKEFVNKMNTYSEPIRLLKVENTDNRLSCGDLDPTDCHLACGLRDSIITIWPLKRSYTRGRKPYALFNERLCDWSNYNCSSSSSDDDSDDIKIYPHRRKRDARQRFTEMRSTENTFNDANGLPLRGHSKGVTDILFSRCNPLLYSVSKDTTLRAWKAKDFSCAAVYKGHNYPIWCVAENPSGNYLATGSRDSTARLWSIEREFPLHVYVGHTQDIDAIAFHPNGSYFATGSTDLTVRLWCVTSGKLCRVFTDCKLPVTSVTFSPNGKLLAAAGEESKIRIFDLAAGSQITELRDHTSTISKIAWNKDGTKFGSCCTDGTVRIWNINSTSLQKNGSSNLNTVDSTSTNSHNTSSNQSTSYDHKLDASYMTDCKSTISLSFNSDDKLSVIGCT